MSAYLSRIQLNPHRRDARRLLASPQRMHAAVLASFPDPVTGAGEGPRVLWRLDQDPRRVFLYVVSPDEPDFAHLAEQGGWPSTERGLVKPYDGFLDRLEVGQQWAFRLAANPTHWGTHPDTGRVQRFGILSNAGQERWLTERAARHGFAITTTTHPGEDGDPVVFPDLVVSGRGLDAFHRPDPDRTGPRPTRDAGDRRVRLARAQYDGRLQITDVGLLREALTRGIGPAKAYGCGLLTLARTAG